MDDPCCGLSVISLFVFILTAAGLPSFEIAKLTAISPKKKGFLLTLPQNFYPALRRA
jgi:hypothetical protein